MFYKVKQLPLAFSCYKLKIKPFIEAVLKINNLLVSHIFTTSSESYFKENGKQLAESLINKTDNKLIVYSESDLSSFASLIEFKPLKYGPEVMNFQTAFRSHYGKKYKFLHYSMKMDIWAYKIAAQLQFLEENPMSRALFLDSDSIVLNKNFVEKVNLFSELAKNVDCGLFKRSENFLHSETGFVILNNSTALLSAFKEMYRKIMSGEYKNLPSWTDSSLIDDQIEQGAISYIDFCEELNLKSPNPIYESPLRKSFIHLKGPRKGPYSSIRNFLGRYQ